MKGTSLSNKVEVRIVGLVAGPIVRKLEGYDRTVGNLFEKTTSTLEIRTRIFLKFCNHFFCRWGELNTAEAFKRFANNHVHLLRFCCSDRTLSGAQPSHEARIWCQIWIWIWQRDEETDHLGE